MVSATVTVRTTHYLCLQAKLGNKHDLFEAAGDKHTQLLPYRSRVGATSGL